MESQPTFFAPSLELSGVNFGSAAEFDVLLRVLSAVVNLGTLGAVPVSPFVEARYDSTTGAITSVDGTLAPFARNLLGLDAHFAREFDNRLGVVAVRCDVD